MYFDEIVKQFSQMDKVEAIALGGSRSTGANDEKSDYDLYIYCNDTITPEEKRAILEKCCDTMEISNHYWELEDNCILKDGIPIDILYRDLDDFEKFHSYVVEQHHAQKGYTTCFWHNLLTCEILFDRNGKLAEQKKRFSVPYPKELKHNIIDLNMKLLSGVLPSFDKQIEKAAKRCDTVSINHRTTEYLASYFDVIFALNELPHPGEKRLIALCKKNCKILPNNFEENLNKLFSTMFNNFDISIIDTITKELKAVVDANT